MDNNNQQEIEKLKRTVLFFGDSLKRLCMLEALVNTKVQLLEEMIMVIFLLMSALEINRRDWPMSNVIAEVLWILAGLLLGWSAYTYFVEKRELKKRLKEIDNGSDDNK